MIKATELRIGNWVNDPSSIHKSANFCAVSELLTETLDVVKRSGAVTTRYHYLDPIPLTPEILKKIKQVEKEWENHYTVKNDECFFTIDFNHTGICVNITPGGMFDQTMGIDLDCKYLHKLQNVFFALTGNELQINLNTVESEK